MTPPRPQRQMLTVARTPQTVQRLQPPTLPLSSQKLQPSASQQQLQRARQQQARMQPRLPRLPTCKQTVCLLVLLRRSLRIGRSPSLRLQPMRLAGSRTQQQRARTMQRQMRTRRRKLAERRPQRAARRKRKRRKRRRRARPQAQETAQALLVSVQGFFAFCAAVFISPFDMPFCFTHYSFCRSYDPNDIRMHALSSPHV